jgi:drug/metabolite transporter (DMT)-like permease
MSRGDILKMILVSLLWALCFPLIKVGLESGTSPLLFITLRSAIASLILFGMAVRNKEPFRLVSENKFLLFVLGLTAFFAYFGMVLGGARVNPGFASVIGNSNPIIASVFAVIFLGESVNRTKAVGLLLGFVGVIMTSVPSLAGESSNSLIGILLVLVGALGAATGNILLKKFASSQIPMSVLAAQFVVCSPLLLLAAIVSAGPLIIRWSFGFSIALVLLAVGGTALADILWLDLLKRNSLTKLNIFIFLTPVISLVLGILFFNERLGKLESLGTGAILIGIFMALQREIGSQKLGRQQAI